MPSHDPLTQFDIDLLNKIELNPIEFTTFEQGNSEEGRATSFLCQTGYLTIEQTYVARDEKNHRWKFTRTSKPISEN